MPNLVKQNRDDADFDGSVDEVRKLCYDVKSMKGCNVIHIYCALDWGFLCFYPFERILSPTYYAYG